MLKGGGSCCASEIPPSVVQATSNTVSTKSFGAYQCISGFVSFNHGELQIEPMDLNGINHQCLRGWQGVLEVHTAHRSPMPMFWPWLEKRDDKAKV